ncbi:MAG TPA: M1 family metallopeptidase [Gemmatimonadaceae bacterium]|nr:M1 family metallopeptidase [Gemmatimonadaceae bacterium]
MLIHAAFLALLQQHPALPSGNSTPPSGDTAGYWQQRIRYTIAATLDEPHDRVSARATLRYVNNSPDTLREMYVHQYLNAFRPGSKWSEIDEREGRDRFQHLREPDYGYERFTAPVRVDGAAVGVDYPGAPDSTVAHFALPRVLAPGDSVVVDFAWDARPSTVPRRQGRRGRHWDLAQWYPKVAVYDRAGWEYNALQPAGEFYGEYGTYDVTLVVADDQVIGATGVPVSGDPGWSRVAAAGAVRTASQAYGNVAGGATVMIPSGYRAVRFVARDVHHFAWSTSPNYRYEGGVYVRPTRTGESPAWDTVSVNVLYQPGDDSTWGGLRAVQRTINALGWLEHVYGTYAYPQMTVLHRLDGGGTEFPMMQMNGSASQGLILHEGGHVFTYGILGNNEWRSGWMDEGLTSYQTSWAEGSTQQEFSQQQPQEPARVSGYRGLAIRPTFTPQDALGVSESITDLQGEAQAIGTRAQDFRDFRVYNDMIYDRAEVMYGQLRDAIGDSAFVAFLHDYYARWKLKHVDERAMRASAERASGRDLGWFFDQWIHHTGVVDYSLGDVQIGRDSSAYVVDVRVRRWGEYLHPIAVGVRTARGWTLGRIDPLFRTQIVRIRTADAPLEVRLDPMHTSWDWNRLNDAHENALGLGHERWNVDWPFLAQADREHAVALVRPMAWYSNGGGVTLGARVRASYLDQQEVQAGLAYVTKAGVALPVMDRLQYWARGNFVTHSRFVASLGAASLDDILKYDIGLERALSTLRGSSDMSLALTYAQANISPGFFGDTGRLLPELWSSRNIGDIAARARWHFGPPNGAYFFVTPSVVLGKADHDYYGKGEFALGGRQPLRRGWRLDIRGYAADEENAPLQRALYLSAQDPVTTFDNHWWRPAGAILKQPNVDWLPLGGGALRGYRWDLPASRLVGTNIELSRQLGTWTRARGRDAALAFRLHAFGDAASVGESGNSRTLSDAGVGVSVSGRLFDRPLFIRLDSPLYVSEPALAIDRGHAGAGRVAPRWALTFNDLW